MVWMGIGNINEKDSSACVSACVCVCQEEKGRDLFVPCLSNTDYKNRNKISKTQPKQLHYMQYTFPS